MKAKSLIDKIKRSPYSINVMLLPFLFVVLLAIFILAFPTDMGNAIALTRDWITHNLGWYYILLGVGFVLVAAILVFSRIGRVRLGNKSKRMSTLNWAILVFTSTMAADILFFSLHEWAYYYNYTLLSDDNLSYNQMLDNALRYPLFHWGIIPWLFYIVPAVAYAFMFYVKKRRHSQKISEACRPLLGKYTDRAPGRIVDIIAVVGLLLGTATTFAVATPLISAAFSALFGIHQTNLMTVIILLCVAALYTLGVLRGLKSISILAKISIILFCLLLTIFFVGGNPIFILDSGISGIGSMLNNFFSMATWTDPTRSTSFPQDWTMFYWAYWIVWAVATPMFIAKISQGRTIREVIVGGLLAGTLGTFVSFIVFGNFGLYHQTAGNIDVVDAINNGAAPASVIILIIQQLPLYPIVLVVLIVTMLCFYASTFDAIAYVMSSYSYKKLDIDAEPRKRIKLFWAVVFMILPIALIFSLETIHTLTAVAIIGALPLSVVFVLVIISFFKEYKKMHRKAESQSVESKEQLLGNEDKTNIDNDTFRERRSG